MKSDRRSVTSPRPVGAWIPSWVHSLGTALWVSGPDGQLAYVNERARDLLKLPPGGGVGSPCHLVVRGRDAAGKPFCGPECSVSRLARRGREIEPVGLQIDSDGETRWVRLITISATAPDRSGPWLVHCILDDDRRSRIERYLTKVKSRTVRERSSETEAETIGLSQREREVLGLLAEDRSLHEIAASLHISYATVRNHVQHILGKLGVHSIMEAVAYHLLSERDSIAGE